MRTKSLFPPGQHGFTLVELIMVIVLMGIIGGMVAVFMRGPIDAYLSQGRRAGLTDAADTTMRRIARDLNRALPNSVRTSSSNCIEFIPTKTGGRYRTDAPGNFLDFSQAVTSFSMLGDPTSFAGSAVPTDQTIAAGDLIVVYNLGISGANAYAGDNYSAVSSVGTVSGGETTINIASKQFPLASGGGRFHVVSSTEKLVSYVCSGSTLYRSTDNRTLSTSTSCATASAPSVSVSPIAVNVNCAGTSFTYSGSDLQRNALVTMVLSLQDSSLTETVNLQHEVHVDNTP